MMARSTTRSNQRPDTLMQDRICQVDETSCNARPDHTCGSIADLKRGTSWVCFCPGSRHRADGGNCLLFMPYISPLPNHPRALVKAALDFSGEFGGTP